MSNEPIISKERLRLIAERIKKLRKEQSLSQERFAEKIGAARETVGTWERAETPIGFAFVMKICEVFSCDPAYLTGYIGEKSHDIKTIHELTGLSETAITKLMQWNNANDRSGLFTNYLSQMIEDNRFDGMMNSFSDMISSAKCWRKSLERSQRYDMEQEKNNYVAHQLDLAKNVTNMADSIAEKEIRG